MATVLVYNGRKIRDQGDFLNLTDMWKADGADPSRPPAEWLRSADAERFIEFVSDNLGISHVIETKPGKNGGTMGHWQIGMAYAKYLSPEFHMWCNSVVRAYMEGRLGATVQRDKMAARRLDIQALNAITRHIGGMHRENWSHAEIRKARAGLLNKFDVLIDPNALLQGELTLDPR